MKKITYKKILVTHDLSKLSASVLPHALALSKLMDAEIILLNIVPTVGQEAAYFTPASIPPIPAPQIPVREITEKDIKASKTQLEKIKKDMEDNGARNVSTAVKLGQAGPEIISFAKKQQCDFIIMSTHGRSGLGRVLLGSVADYVIRHASCPVFVVLPKRNKK